MLIVASLWRHAKPARDPKPLRSAARRVRPNRRPARLEGRLANFGGHFARLQLDVLGQEAAATFLLERTDKQRQETPDDAAAAQQLAVDLGQLALALEQAGAYIAKLGLTFARYRQLWQENWARVASWADPAITKYPRDSRDP